MKDKQNNTDSKNNFERESFDESILHTEDKLGQKLTKKEIRENAEIESSRDLVKSVEQLLCDIHEETHADRPTEANIAGAIKRTASMMAKVSKSNEKLALWMMFLTIIIVILTFLTILFQCLK